MSHTAKIKRTNTETILKHFRENRWGERHARAFDDGLIGASTHAVSKPSDSIPLLIIGLAKYADFHQSQYDSQIGDDGVLGEGFIAALRGVRTLLNGDLGSLDGGTLDGMLVNLAVDCGFSESDL